MIGVEDLSPSDQAVYWTGAVARNDVELEYELLNLHARLTHDPASAPKFTDPLIRAIRKAAVGSEIISGEMVPLLRDLLKRIEAVRDTRNRLVHDLWGNRFDDPTTFDRWQLIYREQPGPDTRHLSEFKQCADDLLVCAFRVTSLLFIMTDRESPGVCGEDEMWAWRQALAGHVERSPGGGYRITSERP